MSQAGHARAELRRWQAAAHEQAAAVHERAAAVHRAAALFFDECGDATRAARERDLAGREAGHAQAERRQAQEHRTPPSAEPPARAG